MSEPTALPRGDDRPPGDALPPGEDWTDVGAIDDFPEGEGRQVRLREQRVAVFRAPGGGFRALADRCPHAGAPLSAGALRAGRVVCSWHGWHFDAATGACTSVSWAAPVPTHPVRVVAGRVQIGPRRPT